MQETALIILNNLSSKNGYFERFNPFNISSFLSLFHFLFIFINLSSENKAKIKSNIVIKINNRIERAANLSAVLSEFESLPNIKNNTISPKTIETNLIRKE